MAEGVKAFDEVAISHQIATKADNGGSPGDTARMSVQDRSRPVVMNDSPLVFHIAASADEIPQWWSQSRDRALDKLWKQEAVLSGAIYSLSAKIAAAKWEIFGDSDGDKAHYTELLNNADLGAGWIPFIFKGVQDLLTQDNGWFIELLRESRSDPEEMVEGVAHLDSQRCERTGWADIPVVYHSARTNQKHRLNYWQVYAAADQPSPREKMKGVGYCATSRAASAAQILRDIHIFKRQKLGGKHVPAIIWAKGIRRDAVEEALEEALLEQHSQGYSHYTKPVIIASPDAGLDLQATLMEFASLPDGYDEDTTMRWYIAILAICFGVDYGEFAPLPGRSLGTATESLVQSEKAKGKGPGTIFNMIERAINYAILPEGMSFSFVGKDASEDLDKAEIADRYSQVIDRLVSSQVLHPAQGLWLATEWLGLPEEILTIQPPEDEEDEDGEAPPPAGDSGDVPDQEAQGGIQEGETKPQEVRSIRPMEQPSITLRDEAILRQLRTIKQEEEPEDEDHSELALLLLLEEYQAEVEQEYEAWVDETAAALDGADEDDREDILDAQLSVLIIDLERMGESYMRSATDAGLDGADGDMQLTAALASAIAANSAYLSGSLGPDLREKFLDAASMDGFSWTSSVIGDTLRGFVYRPLQYIDAIIAPFWRAIGAKLRSLFGRNQPRVMRRLDLLAEHCPTCIPKAGVYPNWETMVSQVGVPGDGSDMCQTHCRCYILQETPGGGWVRI